MQFQTVATQLIVVVLRGQVVHQVGEAIGDGVELVLDGADLIWLFWSNATIRNVTIVVAVLMISCQVSTSSITKYDGAQISTRRTQAAKK